jgi:hypothetical protein
MNKQYTYRYNQFNQTEHFVSEYFSRKGKRVNGWESEYKYNGTLLTRVVGNNIKDPSAQSITEYNYVIKSAD